MTNIKELFDKISVRLGATPTLYTEVRFIIARNIFIFIAVLYYSVWLFTIGGWQKEFMSQATFYLYFLLVGATLWLLACIIEYVLYTSYPQFSRAIYGVWGFFAILFFILAALRLGFLSF